MRQKMRRRVPRFRSEKGQVTIFIVLALALFLLGFIGFAVDMTNLWFHRQMAQGAADAACQAGIMDVLLLAEGANPPSPGFAPGTPFDCASTPNAVPCQYAALNGYSGAGLSSGPSNQVTVGFPGTVPGTPPLPPSIAPVPYLRVDVVDRVGLTFASLIRGQRTTDVRAFAECGLVLADVPIPIIVLNPVCSHSFEVSGSASVKIVGGPPRSVQVNSNSTFTPPNNCAAATTSSGNQCVGNATIDLSQGGPDFTGSNFGTFGGQSPAPPNFIPGTTGTWTSPSTPINDPFALLPPPPPQPLPTTYPLPTGCTVNTNPCAVPYGAGGCPDQTGATGTLYGDTPGCFAFRPGHYTQPIQIKNFTAIFVPGIYYLAPTSYPGDSSGGGLCGKAGCVDHGPIGGQCRASFFVGASGVVRPSTDSGDGNGGTIFYLSTDPSANGYGSTFFGANAGTYGGRIVDPYDPYNAVNGVRCLGGPPINPPLPPALDGNVFLAPCTGPYGSPTGPGFPPPSRRMLFFQDRANADDHGQPTLQGGGGLLLAGTMYYHNCPNSPDCTPGYTATYNAFAQFQGTPGSFTRVIGNIVADQLVLAGNGQIDMVLDPYAVFSILKATLLR